MVGPTTIFWRIH